MPTQESSSVCVESREEAINRARQIEKDVRARASSIRRGYNKTYIFEPLYTAMREQGIGPEQLVDFARLLAVGGRYRELGYIFIRVDESGVIIGESLRWKLLAAAYEVDAKHQERSLLSFKESHPDLVQREQDYLSGITNKYPFRLATQTGSMMHRIEYTNEMVESLKAGVAAIETVC